MTKGSFYAFLLGSALAVTVPSAAALAQSMAELKPTGQWLVNKAGVEGLGQVGMGIEAPCIMANQFHNGFILRLSGGGGQFLSLSLDFRQSAFMQGDSYPVVISVDGGQSHSLTASAFSAGILLVNLRDAPGLYGALQTGRSMAMNVVGNTIIFSLDNIRDGINRLESCFRPPSLQSQTVPQVAAAEPFPTVPDTQVYIKREAGAAADPAQSGPAFRQPTAADILKAEPDANGEAGLGLAAAGNDAMGVPAMPPLTASELAELDLSEEDLKPAGGMGIAKPVVLADASRPAVSAAPKVEASPLEPNVTQDTARVSASSLTPAPRPPASPQAREVAAAPMPPPGAELAAAVDAPDAEPGALRIARTAQDDPLSLTPSPSAASRRSAAPAAPERWEAKAGEDIRIVLSRWATLAGTDLVWEADGGGRVAQDVSMTGSFEEAVSQIMADNSAAMGIRGQFADGDNIKPVAANQSGAASASAGSNAAQDEAPGLNARRGDDLRTVLQRWAAQNDLDLDWQADERFALLAPIEGKGDITRAIEAALIQFDNEPVRPVGRLNRDPETGRLSLTIETDRAS